MEKDLHNTVLHKYINSIKKEQAELNLRQEVILKEIRECRRYIRDCKKEIERIDDLLILTDPSVESRLENARESLYSSVLESASYDEYFVNDQSIKQAFLDFENKVNTIQYLVGDLNELCDDSYYSDNSVNKKCKDYKLVYEQVNNFFVGDVSTYNKNIETYNEVNENKLETYKTTRDYIDYNKDKEYDGR